MQCKICQADRPERDFSCSRGEHEGVCYKCVYEIKKKNTPQRPLTAEPIKTESCKNCGKEFTPLSPTKKYLTNAKYCCDVCRKEGNKNIPSKRERRTRTSDFSYSWKNKNFDFSRDPSHISFGVQL